MQANNSYLQSALTLAKKGFRIFPVVEGWKIPAVKAFTNAATTDPGKIKSWWIDPVLGVERAYNIGIATSHPRVESEALLVVDVDNKDGKCGNKTLLQLELEGFELPKTFCQRTPTGGLHYVYRVQRAVKQGASVLGPGVDIRSRGGYIVGAGSSVEAGRYTCDDTPIAVAPDWLIERCGRSREHADDSATRHLPLQHLDGTPAIQRATHYLSHEAPLAREGEAGDQTTYVVACRVKDFGVSAAMCAELMEDHWNTRCDPPWGFDELARKIANAYRYGVDPVGAASPETQFQKVEDTEAKDATNSLHPICELNKEFGFVITGGGAHILWETTDANARPTLEHLAIPAFHQMLAARTLSTGDGKTKPLSEMWMRSPERRSYDGICFRPEQKTHPRFYNLWQGFAVKPSPRAKALHASVQMFIDHAMENVCNGDKNLFQWLMSYFAHIVQKPWEKPLTALVFKGGKGVGKNALVERIGTLLGRHFLVTADKRYLVGNFNGHFENLLLFVLNEAFWSGDKPAEGVLKGLITEDTHNIERKGQEPYRVENRARIAIIGNEDWLVPASHDERRYAVFAVGDRRKQDRTYFQNMREGMERGGYASLLRYLLDFDIGKTEINEAPATDALMEQKISSLDPFHQWWLECLTEGRIAHSEFGSEWQTKVDKQSVRSAFKRHHRERNIRSRLPEERVTGKLLHACAPHVDLKAKIREGVETVSAYGLGDLETCRKAWDVFIGHTTKW